MSRHDDVSSLAINRLSVYLRCLRHLRREGVSRVSSGDLARRFQLSATQIRKDLAYFGEFGIRGVGYQVDDLQRRLETLLGLDREYRAVIVGAGNLGTALARFPGFNSHAFRVVALFDIDPRKVDRAGTAAPVHHASTIATVVPQLDAQIGVIAVPASAAQENYDALVAAGIQTVLNFAPTPIQATAEVPVKTVDLLIFMEELAYFLQ